MDGITEAAEDPSPSEGEESNEKYYLLSYDSRKKFELILLSIKGLKVK